MAVAKSFANLEIVKEPYEANGRMYVQVRTASGTIRTVRWYTDEEYAKYNHSSSSKKVTSSEIQCNQREALGFGENGSIIIFKGDTYPHKDWFKEHGARYTKWWGWSFPSMDKVPTEVPLGIEALTLTWNAVGNADNTLKIDEQVQSAVEALIYEPDKSEFVGKIGDRLELNIVVEKAIQLEGYYGVSTMHVMRGEDGNVYVWTTASKSWEEGSEHNIRGTVKDHKTYRNINQTILTRCTEVKSK